ncbi:MAG: HTTM domain-containing protein [Pseudomonadota bacterium]
MASGAPLNPLRQSLERVFALDLRSVALFRVGLALAVLADTAYRSGDLVAFYTDVGVLPVVTLREDLGVQLLSLHALSGGSGLQVALFSLTAVAALAMLVGYRSQLAAFVCWALVMSVQHRNPLLGQGGDDLLVILLFFAFLLPLGARFAVDAALTPARRAKPNTGAQRAAADHHSWFSVLSVAVVLQVLYLYFFTALLKDGASWHADGDAAGYAVHLEDYARTAGVWLRDWPALLGFGTHYVWWVELLAPALVLSPVFSTPARLVGLALLASLHLSFALFLRIGLFPLIDFVALSLLLPGAVWRALDRLPGRAARARVVLWYDGDCVFCLKMCLVLRAFFLPRAVPILRAQGREDVFAVMQRENTWVVTDAEGRLHRHGGGLRVLVRLSAWAWPAAWLLDRAWCAQGVDAVYRWVAHHRGRMGQFTDVVLPWRAQSLQPALPAEVLAFALLAAITFHNVTGLPAYRTLGLVSVDRSLAQVGLDQRWDMFAPVPRRSSERMEVLGYLDDGTVVDAWHRAPDTPNFTFDVARYRDIDNNRWRKLKERVQARPPDAVNAAFGRFVCARWSTHGAAPLDRIEVYRVRSITPSVDGAQPRRDTAKRVWDQDCTV